MSIHPSHAHAHEAFPWKCLHLLAQPSLLKRMTPRDRLPQAHAYYLPSFAIIVEPKHAHELLEMIVEHGMVHARVDVVEGVSDDRVTRNDVQRDASGHEKCRWMHAQSSKVTNHKSAKFVRGREGKARDGILWVCFERDAVFQHRRQECSEE